MTGICRECGRGLRLNMANKEWECPECTGATEAEQQTEINEPDREESRIDEYLEPMRSELITDFEGMIGGGFDTVDMVDTLIALIRASITKHLYKEVLIANKPAFIPP